MPCCTFLAIYNTCKQLANKFANNSKRIKRTQNEVRIHYTDVYQYIIDKIIRFVCFCLVLIGCNFLPYKQRVGGSSPSTPTIKKHLQKCRCFFYWHLPYNLPYKFGDDIFYLDLVVATLWGVGRLLKAEPGGWKHPGY